MENINNQRSIGYLSGLLSITTFHGSAALRKYGNSLLKRKGEVIIIKTAALYNLLKETVDLSNGKSPTLTAFQCHADQAVIRAVRLAIAHC